MDKVGLSMALQQLVLRITPDTNALDVGCESELETQASTPHTQAYFQGLPLHIANDYCYTLDVPDSSSHASCSPEQQLDCVTHSAEGDSQQLEHASSKCQGLQLWTPIVVPLIILLVAAADELLFDSGNPGQLVTPLFVCLSVVTVANTVMQALMTKYPSALLPLSALPSLLQVSTSSSA